MDKIKYVLDKIVEFLCIAILMTMTILVTWQVFTRYALGKPSTITEQLAQYLFVWLVFYAAAYIFGKRSHMAIVFLQDKFPFKIKKIVMIIQEMIILAFSLGAMLYGGFSIMMKQFGQTDAALQIPIGVIYSAIPAGGILVVFYSVYNVLNIAKEKE